MVFGLTLVVTSKQQYKMSLSPKSESSSKKLQEQRHQNENEPKHDAAAEWQQQDIDIAAKIDDLTTQIDAYKHSLMIDRKHLEEMNCANEFMAQNRFAQPPEVTAQGRILEAIPALELEDYWKTDEQRQLEQKISEKENQLKNL